MFWGKATVGNLQYATVIIVIVLALKYTVQGLVSLRSICGPRVAAMSTCRHLLLIL